ncbi:hypothetical protein ID866_9219, partial [Astraeus odoratus]
QHLTNNQPIFQHLHSYAYLDWFLVEGVRQDAHTLEEWRDVFINVGSISAADGSALVGMGETTIACGVRAQIVEPELDTPEEGLHPLKYSPKHRPPCHVLAQIQTRATFREGSGAIRATQRGPGQGTSFGATTYRCTISPSYDALYRAWLVCMVSPCINYDGMVFDAALAMVAAL